MSDTQQNAFPANWLIGQDFNPNDHMLNLKGKDYLGVQMRQLWFIRDQRALIAAGLDHTPYVLRTELVELDREAGWAHFMTTARDVLGNESVAYGSESVKDFPDYIEKAATKSLGRALVGLGYGTGAAPEMDEGERVVDAPVQRRSPAPTPAPQPRQSAAQRPQPQPHAAPTPATPAPAQRAAQEPAQDEPPATDQQAVTIRRLCDALGRGVPVFRTYTDASRIITQLNNDAKQQRKGA